MNEVMADEFATVAAWTAQAALALGADHFVPAGCRGSGSPAELAWLLDRLAPAAGEHLLDVGAGVGGPAAFAAERAGVRPVLVEPEIAACRAAARLFRRPVIAADGAALPLAAASFDVAWCLGVLCTTPNQPALLGELRRVLTPTGRLGLLVFTAARPVSEPPEGNDFPTPAALNAMIGRAGFVVEAEAAVADFGAAPPSWARRVREVEDEIDRRHGDDEAWSAAREQSARFGRLLRRGEVVGSLLTLHGTGQQ